MANLTLALDLEGVLITNAISQLPRPGLMLFLNECEKLFGHGNICIFTAVDENRFRPIAEMLVAKNLAPTWFSNIRYIDWVGEHKDLRFVDDNIDNVIILDDYPPYIKQTQKHRLISIKQYQEPYTHAMPDMNDREFARVLKKLKSITHAHNS